MVTTVGGDNANGELETEGYVCPSVGKPLELRKVVLPPLKETQVEVDMLLSGLCYTDISCTENHWQNIDFPLLPGHEGIGVVRKVGSAVKELSVGTRVAIGWIRDSCKSCRRCNEYRENLCHEGYQGLFLSSNAGKWGSSPLKYNTMGGCFVRIQRIEERFAVPLPDNLPAEIVAPLCCGGGTVYEPIREFCNETTILAVSSIGGLGSSAIKLAQLRGITVWALSSSPKKRETALKLGCQKFVCVNNEEEMAEIAGKVDVLLETSPANSDLPKFMNCLKMDGSYVRAGIPSVHDQSFKHDWIPLIFQNQKICGTVVTGSGRMKELFKLVSDNIELVEKWEGFWTTEHYKMQDVNIAMERLKNRENKGYRILLKW